HKIPDQIIQIPIQYASVPDPYKNHLTSSCSLVPNPACKSESVGIKSSLTRVLKWVSKKVTSVFCAHITITMLSKPSPFQVPSKHTERNCRECLPFSFRSIMPQRTRQTTPSYIHIPHQTPNHHPRTPNLSRKRLLHLPSLRL